MNSLESRAKELFLDALERPAAERRAFVEAGSAGDDALSRRVEELLAAHDEPTSGAELHAVVDLEPGASLGPYRLLSRLGEGGFGVVFLAEQEQPVRRQVALKVVKLGMDTLRVISRFEHERQTLALMDHPGIARVLDAGATATGRPYFVMERVDGVPLTEYCAERRLGLETRLRLFAGVCHAVQHAHQRGVIHRDLKPSNVLVAEIDGAPLPKVIDFGIAKALEGELADRTAYTGEGQAIGTPAYMSPEQMRGVADVDTRTDVYALGVILYQLLSGALPFDPETLGIDAVRDAVQHRDPPPPSVRLRAARGTTSLEAVPRELDWVVMRCLAKDRERRYTGAAALARDVDRVLEHAPVEAAPPSLGYRIRKFVRRHRVGTGAAAVVLLLAIGAAAAVAAAWYEARRERRLALSVNDFLVHDVLGSMMPSRELKRGTDVTMRWVLDAAAKRIDEAAAPGGRFAGDPLIEAQVRSALGGSFYSIGRLGESEAQFAIAERLRRRELGDAHTDTLASIQNHASALRGLARYAESERLLRELVGARERRIAEDEPGLIVALSGLAATLVALGRRDEAQILAHRILEMTPDDDDLTHQGTRQNVARVLALCDRNDDALRLWRRAHDVHRRAAGAEHPETLMIGSNLARALQVAGKVEEGAMLLEEVLAGQIRLFGLEHPESLISAYHVANQRVEEGRLDDADALAAEAAAAARRVYGAQGPVTLRMLGIQSRIRQRQQRFDEAEALLDQALAALEGMQPLEKELRIQFLNDLASLFSAQDRDAEAEAPLRSALALAERTLGAGHGYTTLIRENLARLLRHLGRDAEAAALDALDDGG